MNVKCECGSIFKVLSYREAEVNKTSLWDCPTLGKKVTVQLVTQPVPALDVPYPSEVKPPRRKP
mgnify:CR=1 FL=1